MAVDIECAFDARFLTAPWGNDNDDVSAVQLLFLFSYFSTSLIFIISKEKSDIKKNRRYARESILAPQFWICLYKSQNVEKQPPSPSFKIKKQQQQEKYFC